MRRRHFLMTTGLAAGGAAGSAPGSRPGLAAALGRPEIRITDIKTWLVGVGRRNLVFVKVETDQGIHGVGEAYSCGPDQATVATIHDFKSWLVGRDPRDIEHLWALMHHSTRFPGGLVVNAALSGIEQALWDIHGKAAGLPVYRLLGGKCRDKIRVYQSAGGDEPRAVAEQRPGPGAAVRLHGGEDVARAPPGGNTQPSQAQVTRVAARRVGRRARGCGTRCRYRCRCPREVLRGPTGGAAGSGPGALRPDVAGRADPAGERGRPGQAGRERRQRPPWPLASATT